MQPTLRLSIGARIDNEKEIRHGSRDCQAGGGHTWNVWVHVWAYHALAPHTLIDTLLMVKVFGIH